jgi:hypothetical protein
LAGWNPRRAHPPIAQRIEEQRELIALWGTEVVDGVVVEEAKEE